MSVSMTIYIYIYILQVFTYAPKMHHFKYKILWCTKMSCKILQLNKNLMAAFHMGKEIFLLKILQFNNFHE